MLTVVSSPVLRFFFLPYLDLCDVNEATKKRSARRVANLRNFLITSFLIYFYKSTYFIDVFFFYHRDAIESFLSPLWIYIIIFLPCVHLCAYIPKCDIISFLSSLFH